MVERSVANRGEDRRQIIYANDEAIIANNIKKCKTDIQVNAKNRRMATEYTIRNTN